MDGRRGRGLRARDHVLARLLGAPCWRWADRGGVAARLRRWFNHVVLRHESETCDQCGGQVKAAWWCEDDELWCDVYEAALGWRPEAVFGVRRGLMCRECFIRIAVEIGVPIEWRACRLR